MGAHLTQSQTESWHFGAKRLFQITRTTWQNKQITRTTYSTKRKQTNVKILLSLWTDGLVIIVGKKRDPGILDPELFLAQIRKVEARLGKLAKIRKSVIN